jgi:hypothetical protein
MPYAGAHREHSTFTFIEQWEHPVGQEAQLKAPLELKL